MDADINAAYEEYVKSGDPAALEEVINHGKGIIQHFASIYGNGLDRDDLYQTGVMGLLHAVRTFEPNHGAAFSTWAASCIISEIRHYVRKERAFLNTNFDSDETENSAYTDKSEIEGENAKQYDRAKSFHLDIEDKIMLEQATEKLGQLQRNVIDALYFKGMTQQQTADELGITQRRVSRLKSASLKLMRELLNPASFHLIDSKQSFKNFGPRQTKSREAENNSEK